MLARIQSVVPFGRDGMLIWAEEMVVLCGMTVFFGIMIAVMSELMIARPMAQGYIDTTVVSQPQFSELSNRVLNLESATRDHEARIATIAASNDELLWESRLVLGGIITLLLSFGWRRMTERKTGS